VTDTAGIGDQNFNDLANAGGTRAAEELGVEFEVLESQTQADYVSNLTLALEQSDVAVAVGFLLGDAVNEVAPQFPDRSIVFIDEVSENENVQSVLFRENEGAFLAGILAGLSTTTGQVGMVGGIRVPPVMRYEVGFAAGVATANPDVVFTSSYADDFEDPALGKELTLALYDGGSDIVLQAAGRTGIGCFDAANEKGAGFFVIAGDTDQSHLGAEAQIAFVRKGVDEAVFQGIEQVVNGNFEAGIRDLGLAEAGMDLGGYAETVDPAIAEMIGAYKQAIIDGTITVPADDDQFAAFVPTPLDGAAPPASPVASPAA
jgi:basic membrane protein A